MRELDGDLRKNEEIGTIRMRKQNWFSKNKFEKNEKFCKEAD